MKVTIKDCLSLGAFSKAKVLAGENNLDNMVKKVSVLEAGKKEDILKFGASNNQMMLTSFYGIRNDEIAQCDAVEALAEGGNTALVIFHVGEIVKEVFPKVIETAEKVGLPLISVSSDSPLDIGDAINEITSQLFYGSKDFSNALISNTIFHLLNFEKYSNFPAAAKGAALSNDFQLILLSEDFNPVLSVETRHRTTISEAIRLGKEKTIEKKSTVYTMIDVNGVLTYWGPVTIDNKQYFMFIVDNEDSYSTGEITKLAEIIEIAISMWRYTPERDARAEMIKALKRGNMSLAYNLRSEVDIEQEDIISVFFAKGIEKGEAIPVIDSFEKATDLSILRINEEEETYGMIVGNRETGKSLCIDLFNTLKEEKNVRIFHVTGLDGIEGAGDAYRLIGESWSFVQNVFPYKRVFTKYELALVSNCINIQIQGGYVRRNYMDLLEPFKEAGENKSKQLLETLETFVLDAGMNSGKTAEFMSIHTNTVQYRLKKINDILGVEITGNRVIPGLTIALALKRLEHVVS